MNKILKIHDKDNVMVALRNLKKGDVVNGIVLLNDIPKGHKFACVDIEKHSFVNKYNAPIGKATTTIKKGEHVHIHNVETTLDDIETYTFNQDIEQFSIPSKKRLIDVYERKNGEIGIRNELWIIPTVGCVNATTRMMKNIFERTVDVSKIDGIYTFSHPYGCSQMGDDHENTKMSLQDIAKHPNAGGVLVVGLGCENNQLNDFKATLGKYNESRFRFLNLQDVEDEIDEALCLLTELYNMMIKDKRTQVPISRLIIGLECGGSDGLSGITANPLVGRVSDYIVKNGGSTVLTEVPEMFGAEKELMKRAKDETVFIKIVKMINNFKSYYKRHHQVVYDNPSPGNKEGGITTLEDKSLGCTQKAGRAMVSDVLNYGERVREKGLCLLSAPGNDIVATTALGMAGCHMVLFTTGRGTPFGGFIPTVKISTNTDLACKKKHWIDFDAGRLVTDTRMDDLTEECLDFIALIASGKKTKNEINDFREIGIFKTGVTL